ncbi:protein hexamerization [Parelaphostrongylus tenuis]|uniref:microtubule-severing ATPase n=1 Tax=Parelaphostrongylus tenuis TaxID=148309 RepID=A0AAD5R9R0_PARTN|nr:protein hexamerization [Parelaphostrongylus tenuis]
MSVGARREMTMFNFFMNHFNTGRAKMMKAVEIDEEFGDSHRDKKLQACELYKQGMDEFRKAAKIDTIDVLPEKRKEVAEAKEKMDSYNRSAKERFVTLMAKMEGSTSSAHSFYFPNSTNVLVASSELLPYSPSRSGNFSLLIPSRYQLLKGVDAALGERLLGEILDRTGVKLSDVIGCDAAKGALEEAVILPALNPALFSGLRQPVKGILLFGPPGNGKTLLAKAVASESNQVFFNVSAASLTSKWVGESEKTIRSLFQIAKNAQPAIIFIDEIDSMLCDRSEKDTDGSRRMKNRIFYFNLMVLPAVQMTEFWLSERQIDHMKLDDAVLRRFPKRIYLGLPDRRSRFTLLKAILDKHNMSAGLANYDIMSVPENFMYHVFSFFFFLSTHFVLVISLNVRDGGRGCLFSLRFLSDCFFFQREVR